MASSIFSENPFLLLGIFLATGYIISLALRNINIPHVVVYLLTGFFLTNTLLSQYNVTELLADWFSISEKLALGLIGFKIGTELKVKLLRKDPKFITVVLLAEALTTLVIVFLGVYLIFGDLLVAIIMGGIATATAPAATVEILRKLKAKGPLTQKIQWILAFDDVVAVVVVEIILSLVWASFGEFALSSFFLVLFRELILAIILGFVIGLILDEILERMSDDLEVMELSFGVLILSIGAALLLNTSVIATTMVVGATVTNKKGDNYEKGSDLLEYIMSPIIMIFFVLVGAQLSFADFNPFPALAFTYLGFRMVGKIGGAYFGAKYVDAEPAIKNNLGFGLLAQGGVSLGLVAVAANIMDDVGQPEIGHLLISSVIVSTVLSVIIGSIGANFAITRAGEDHKLGKQPPREPHYHEDEEEMRIDLKES